MHSSRMRTGRSLTVCCSLLCGGGGVPGLGGCLVLGGWSGGCLLLGGCLLPGVSTGGVCSGGVCVFSQGGDVSAPEGRVCVSAPGGRWASQHALRQTPLPPVDRQMLVKILPWPNFIAAGKYNC